MRSIHPFEHSSDRTSLTYNRAPRPQPSFKREFATLRAEDSSPKAFAVATLPLPSSNLHQKSPHFHRPGESVETDTAMKRFVPDGYFRAIFADSFKFMKALAFDIEDDWLAAYYEIFIL